jgi:hypothetical protein
MLVATIYGDAFYRQFALRLRESAAALGIPCEVIDATRGKEFFDEARRRPRLLLCQLLDPRKEDLLLIDPDSIFHHKPTLLMDRIDFDVAAYSDRETQILSGPLFLRRNARVHQLIQDWRRQSDANQKRPELESLSRLLCQPGSKLEVARLPITYAWVERLHRKRYPSVEPVITHFMTERMITSRREISKKAT